MTDWQPKRFWTDATVETAEGGFAVRLDGRPVRTPLKARVVVPSNALACGMADEWRAQGERIDPVSMPLTRAVNVTLDKVRPGRPAIVADLAGYGTSDLLCYRATEPEGLLARQVAGWDPVLDRADAELGARLATTQGVVPVAQPANALEALHARVEAFDPWHLTALSEFVSLSGSLVLGLFAMKGDDPDGLWALSRIDEDWQVEQWGEDAEEAARVAARRAAFGQAHRYLTLLRSD